MDPLQASLQASPFSAGLKEPHIGVSLKTRRTRQQDAIMRVLREAKGPLDAVEVHERAAQLVPQVSRATVYRALQRLQDKGRINCITPYNEAARYGLSGVSHQCFYCRDCHRSFDLQSLGSAARNGDAAQAALGALAAHTGSFRVECYELRLHGLCPDCTRAPL